MFVALCDVGFLLDMSVAMCAVRFLVGHVYCNCGIGFPVGYVSCNVLCGASCRPEIYKKNFLLSFRMKLFYEFQAEGY